MAGIINDGTLKGGLFEGTTTAVTEPVTGGIQGGAAEMRDLVDVETFGAADDEFLQYDAAQDLWLPHTLTTTSLIDVDNTGKADGAVLVYNGTSSKYEATRQVANQNLFIKGGSY